jgi:hypothetical protein
MTVLICKINSEVIAVRPAKEQRQRVGATQPWLCNQYATVKFRILQIGGTSREALNSHHLPGNN